MLKTRPKPCLPLGRKDGVMDIHKIADREWTKNAKYEGVKAYGGES